MTIKTVQLTDIGAKGEHLPSKLVQMACSYESSVNLSSNGKCLNAKSLMGILSFDFQDGMVVEISADGDDEKEAVKALAEYLQ